MGMFHQSIASFQSDTAGIVAQELHEELELYGDMLDLILSGAGQSPLATASVDGEVKSAILMLIARAVNDFEACRHLITRGLAEQLYIPLRDAVECAGLIVLFLVNDDRALRWMSDLRQYEPGSVRALLREQGFDFPEYALYSALSNLAHCNLLGAVTQVSEHQFGADTVSRVYRFGGYRNLPWLRLEMCLLLGCMWLMLRGSLAQAVKSFEGDFSGWWERVVALRGRLLALGVNWTEEPPDGPTVSESRVSVELRLFDFGLLDRNLGIIP
ncbi:MAG: hypothetical protein KGK07_03205 [Chloroflexota bacterium]|nr:hypothetical protein [Chloroflexota bacterium]